MPEHTTHPYSVPPYATDSARAQLPRDFFARLGGWLPTDPATDSVSVSIGVARRNHAASERPLLPGSSEKAAAYSFTARLYTYCSYVLPYKLLRCKY